MRIGVDVGGTHTDTVLMDGMRVLAKNKSATSEDVTTGIVSSPDRLLSDSSVGPGRIRAVMIGTTHFTNAVVERSKLLTPTAVLRMGLPATKSVEPYADWPEDLRGAIGGHSYLVHGGYEYDGRVIADLNESELRNATREMLKRGVRSVAISCVFSPVRDEMEHAAAAIVAEEAPDIRINLSHEIGRLGLLERENATAMNACLRELASKTVHSFQQSLADLQIEADLYLTQNDGTLMRADAAEKFPVLTFASGPTNSMRGAAFLSGLQDALVVDVGGTTTDIGALVDGFPRASSVAARIGGVFTNFRMPDIYSFGLGGGSLVRTDPLRIGPESVGYRLTDQGLVFGGGTLMATDIAVSAGKAELGDGGLVAEVPDQLAAEADALMVSMVERALDRIRLSPEPEEVILVGGGSILVGDELGGASRVVRPEHFEVANAVGAAIAQFSGEVDTIFALDGQTREACLESAKQEARERAVSNGARPDGVEIVDLEDVPLTYLEGDLLRVRAKVVGEAAV